MMLQHAIPAPYTKREFWETYARMYWSGHSAEIEMAAERVAAALATDTRDHLRVLVLGIGTGTIELPLLTALNRCGRQVEVVGIDLHSEPLAVTARLLGRGLDNMPQSTDEFLALMREGWPKEISLYSDPVARVDSHTLICDDLDFERSDTSSQFKTSAPSRWWARIHGLTGTNPSEGPTFDIVVASFILFHLAWWRPTLMGALDLLKPGGLFLHPYITNHEEIFEGRSPTGNCPEIAHAVFLNGFFARGLPKDYSLRPRAAAATRPYAVNAFLRRLMHFGMEAVDSRQGEEKPGETQYTLAGRAGLDDYLTLLRTRGFSTFQAIDAEMGSKVYDLHLDEVETRVRAHYGSNQVDELNLPIHWQMNRRTNGNLHSAPWCRKFIARAAQFDPKEVLSQAAERNYELEEATSEMPPKAPTASDEELRVSLVRHMATSGLFHEGCIAGDFAHVGEAAQGTDFTCFANPLYAGRSLDAPAPLNRAVPELALYMAMLADLGTYSNTEILLKKVMPRAARPPVFVYVRGERCCVELRGHRDYDEIRFHVPQIWQMLLEDETIDRARVLIKDAVDAATGFTFKIGTEHRGRLKTLCRQTTVEGVEEYVNRILGSSDLVTPDHDHAFVEALAQSVCPEMITTMLRLNIISEWKMLVIFPATFYDKDKHAAEHAVILFYDRLLDDIALDHEYRKITMLYRREGIARAQERSQKWAVASDANVFAHEVSQIATAFSEAWMPELGTVFKVQTDKKKPRRDALGVISVRPEDLDFVNNSRIALVPELLSSLAAVLSLWSFSPRTANYFANWEGESPPATLGDCVDYAWKIGIDCLVVHALKHTVLSGRDAAARVNEYRDIFRRFFRLKVLPHGIGNELTVQWPHGASENADQPQLWLMRTLQTITFNAIRYGSPAADFTLRVEPVSEGRLSFIWENAREELSRELVEGIIRERLDVRSAPSVDELFSTLISSRERMGKTPIGARGADALVWCLEQLDGAILTKPPDPSGDYRLAFSIPTKRMFA